jgi:hypothetical protein
MSLEIMRYVLTPVFIQISISYVLAKFTKSNAQIAFTLTLLLVNVPIIMAIIYFRIVNHSWCLFTETWLNCSMILQSLFYYNIERGSIFSNAQYATLLIIFMNEITYSLGNWFGHNIITASIAFFVIKILLTVFLGIFPKYEHPIWGSIIILENIIISCITLVYLWTATIIWFIPMFLVSIPFVYPTTNATISPSAPQQGWITIAPAVNIMLIKNEEVPQEEEEHKNNF